MDTIFRLIRERFLAIIWLFLCAAVLAFGFERREAQDMPVAFTWLMILLSAPIGFLAMVGIMVVRTGLLEALGFAHEPFFNVLPLWIAAVVGGYLQWFVLVPWTLRRLIRQIQKVTQHSEQHISLQRLLDHPRTVMIAVLAVASIPFLYAGSNLGPGCMLLAVVVATVRGPRSAVLMVAIVVPLVFVYFV